MSILETPLQENTVDMNFEEMSDDVAESPPVYVTDENVGNDDNMDLTAAKPFFCEGDEDTVTIEVMEKLKCLLDGVERDFENGLQLLSQSAVFDKFTTIIRNLKDKLGKDSRTAKLWIQYLDYIQVVKNFIRG